MGVCNYMYVYENILVYMCVCMWYIILCVVAGYAQNIYSQLLSCVDAIRMTLFMFDISLSSQ